MNITLSDILAFVRDYGLTITLLLGILIGGARRWWYFSAAVEDLKKQYEARLGDKNEQIERWQKVAEQNGVNLKESIELNRQMKDTLDDIRDDLRAGRRARGGTSS